MNNNIKKIVLICMSLLIIIGIFYIIINLFGGDKKGIILKKSNNYQDGYISSADKEVDLLDKEFKSLKKVSRGTKIKIAPKSTIDGNTKYKKITLDNNTYYVKEEYTTIDMENIIQEKEMFVRTPATVYYESDSSKILGLVKKGENVNILGYDKINKDGSVNKYKIKYNDISGYVYAKYLVKNKEEAIKYYDEENTYQYHLKIGDNLGGGTAATLDYYPEEKPAFEDNVMPDEVRSLYLNVSAIRNVDNYISFAKENNINAFVVDIKDNTMPGYESNVMKEYSITNYNNAVSTFDEYKGYIKKLKDNGFYVIGRITVFKDSYFVTDHPEVAIKNNSDGTPFNHNGSYWPSAFQRLVWEFNVSLAREAIIEMGFNEIQFDYVRFPDRTLNLEKNNVMNMNNTYNESKAEALQGFLMYARDEIHSLNAYISADVFGECTHNYVTSYGQYWPAISNIVDVISGMPYPDHFNAHEYGIEEVVWTVPYKLLNTWGGFVSEKQSITPSKAKVRTWIQTYNTVKSPYVTYDASKISDQIRALYANGLTNGYMTWNSGSSLTKYNEVKEAFKKEYLNE